MKRVIAIKIILLFIIFIFLCDVSFAENAGSRGSYSRAGWAGARYCAAGMTGEVLADDVFSIYWNPAGLTELKSRKKLTEAEIREKARSGDVDDITEEDLLTFSDEQKEPLFFDIGASYSHLDIEREAGFGGLAFNAFKGVFGAGFFSITSGNIETRDENGILTGKANYTGSVGFISYAVPYNIVSFGFSIKGYSENIGDASYYGAGADIGAQIYILPFLRMGVMVRDCFGYLSPQNEEDSEDKYDFFKPEIRIGSILISDAGVKIAFSGIRKLEQNTFDYGVGVEFDLTKKLMLSAGLSDGYFSTGFTLKLLNMDMSYALNFDKIDYGYNNTISVAVLF